MDDACFVVTIYLEQITALSTFAKIMRWAVPLKHTGIGEARATRHAATLWMKRPPLRSPNGRR